MEQSERDKIAAVLLDALCPAMIEMACVNTEYDNDGPELWDLVNSIKDRIYYWRDGE